MKKLLIFGIICSFLVSCKPKQQLLVTNSKEQISSTEQIIALHKNAMPDFQTLTASVAATYSDGKNEQNLPLSLRMEKDNAIWFSAPMGVAKAYVTPEKVRFYNRLDNTFFDGDFSVIQKLLGFEVNFEQLQNLLLGQIIFAYQSHTDFSLIKNTNETTTQKTIIQNTENQLFTERYEIMNDFHRVNSAMLSDPKNTIYIDYIYQKTGEVVIPFEINIRLKNQKETAISLKFSGVELNQKINFPFKIPSGMKEIK